MPAFSLMLRNARIFAAGGLTIRPDADAVAVRAGRIAAVGRYREIAGGVGPDTAAIDCDGRTVMPGLVDDHVHIFAAAARDTQVDCRHSGASRNPASQSGAAAIAPAARKSHLSPE